MSGIDTARTALLLGLALATASGRLSLGLLYAGAFLLGVFETVYSAAVHAAVPALVGRDSLDRANGYLFSALDGGQQLAGPAVGGLLFAAAAALPLVVDSISFAGSAALVLLALRPSRRAEAEAPVARPASTIRADIATGWRFFVRSRPLRALSVVIGSLACCQAMVMAVLVLYALEVLHLSKAGFGLFMGAASVGNVVGGVVAERVRQRFGTATVIIAGALTAAAAYAGVAATRNAVVACAALVVEAVAVACGNVASVSFRQRVVPDELLGRVGNAFRMVVLGAIPVGAVIGGLVAGAIGLVPTFFIAAGVQCALTIGTARTLRREIRPFEVLDLRDAGPAPAPDPVPVLGAVPVGSA